MITFFATEKILRLHILLMSSIHFQVRRDGTSKIKELTMPQQLSKAPKTSQNGMNITKNTLKKTSTTETSLRRKNF
jgi:hypothetical protein